MMKIYKNLFRNIFLVVLIVLVSAYTNSPKSQNYGREMQRDTLPSSVCFSGNYVSPGYFKRNEGYDWVAVLVNQSSVDKLSILVRSRADKKKPTCLLDFEAFQTSDSTYYAIIDRKKVIVGFKGNKISIAPEHREDEAILFFYCSGGATVAGTYSKIDTPLDERQIDKTRFAKVLKLQNVGFNISSIKKGAKEELTIYPFGLSLENQTINVELEGSITNAEVEDLDSDGYPELLVYTHCCKKRIGNVLGYTVENQTKIQPINFPMISENSKINDGYNGSDEFTIIETSLGRRFPLFENGEPTQKMRQILYKLEHAGSSKKFVVVNVTEY